MSIIKNLTKIFTVFRYKYEICVLYSYKGLWRAKTASEIKNDSLELPKYVSLQNNESKIV